MKGVGSRVSGQGSRVHLSVVLRVHLGVWLRMHLGVWLRVHLGVRPPVLHPDGGAALVLEEVHLHFVIPGTRFRVWAFGFRVPNGVSRWGIGPSLCGIGFGIWGLGFGVWGPGFGVWGLWFRVYGFGFTEVPRSQEIALP